MLEEKISKRLKVPYVELKRNGKTYYLCNNGVIFADKEYLEFADLNTEYERRAKEDMLYDYTYCKNTGFLRKKRGYAKALVDSQSNRTESQKSNVEEQDNERIHEESVPSVTPKVVSVAEQKETDEDIQKVYEPNGNIVHVRRTKEVERDRRRRDGRSIFLIILILAFASVCSMYESTLHTATYLFDYVDMISAWLLSTAVTAYNSSAFEVSVMFHTMKRNFMAFIFMLLWAMVTVFSMATTVSVFYDRFNFNETQIAQENKAVDSNKLGLELLRTKEKDLREAIDFKKKDIEYRQEREYATTAVRLELENLQKKLQENLTEQQKLLADTPEVMEEKLQRKESLFAFLGRLIGLEGGILEFIMSVMSAVFINLISPMSLSAVIELNKRKEK
jgi:hypothetical protein